MAGLLNEGATFHEGLYKPNIARMVSRELAGAVDEPGGSSTRQTGGKAKRQHDFVLEEGHSVTLLKAVTIVYILPFNSHVFI